MSCFDALGGRFTLTINGTYVTKYEFSDWIVQGVKVANGADDVGYRNSSTDASDKACRNTVSASDCCTDWTDTL